MLKTDSSAPIGVVAKITDFGEHERGEVFFTARCSQQEQVVHVQVFVFQALILRMLVTHSCKHNISALFATMSLNSCRPEHHPEPHPDTRVQLHIGNSLLCCTRGTRKWCCNSPGFISPVATAFHGLLLCHVVLNNSSTRFPCCTSLTAPR
jgi:hypothetical protein